MTSNFSSDCECSNCMGSAHTKSDCDPRSNNSDSDSSGSRSSKKHRPSSGMPYFLSHPCATRLENDNKKGSGCLSSEEEGYGRPSSNNHFGLNPEGIARKIRQVRELTVEELLVQEFGDDWKFHPSSMSVGRFRDQVVMKFRRALYYSGMWVTHVPGYKFEKHFSAHYFKKNPGCLQRLVPWLKRELTAVYGYYGYTVKNLLSAILRHMTEYDLDSESFVHLLEPYLHQHTHHFLHEFISFVHSPYSMETYDQRAIYQCPASPWVKKKPKAFAPDLPLCKDRALLASQHDTGESENASAPCNNQQRLLPSLKRFPNGNSSLKGSDVPLVHHKTASKIPAQSKAKQESGSPKGTISTNSMLLNCTMPRERGPGLQKRKQNVHEREMEGVRLLPGHAQDLGEGETAARTFSSPEGFNQEKQWKCSRRGRKILGFGQHRNFQEKEPETNTFSDSSPKVFQRQLLRGRSLIRCKARREPSWSGISENALSSTRDGRKLSSFRKKRLKRRQPSHSAEVGSHSSRRLQRQSRPCARRSKSWCVRLTKRSVSTESRNPSPRGSHRSECFTKNMCHQPSKENVHGPESNHQRVFSALVQYVKLPSTAGQKPKYPSEREGASQAGSHCNSPTCPLVGKYRTPSKQEMKQKSPFPRARETRGVWQENNKCQCPDIQTTEKLGDEEGHPNAMWQVSCVSEHVPFRRRQTSKKKSCSLQKPYWVENEQNEDQVSEAEMEVISKSRSVHSTNHQGSLKV